MLQRQIKWQEVHSSNHLSMSRRRKNRRTTCNPHFQRETSEKTQATVLHFGTSPELAQAWKPVVVVRETAFLSADGSAKRNPTLCMKLRAKTGEDLERKPIIRKWWKVRQSPKRQLWKAWGQILTNWSSSALAMECTEKDRPASGAKSRTYILNNNSGMSYHSPK